MKNVLYIAIALVIALAMLPSAVAAEVVDSSGNPSEKVGVNGTVATYFGLDVTTESVSYTSGFQNGGNELNGPVVTAWTNDIAKAYDTTVTVKDTKDTSNANRCFMTTSIAGTIYPLDNKFQVKGGDIAAFTDLSDSGVTILSNSAFVGSQIINDVFFNQPITDITKCKAGDYGIELKFSATFG